MMYRLLVVDDEPIIVDGLIDLFSDASNGPELELYWAYSADDALKCLNTTRIDIVLTDIEMPEMNGLALQKEINARWPRCKVIFLTGYNDFNFIHASSRNGASDYVLKTEGDAQILAAVSKAVGKLDEDLAVQQMLRKAETQMSLALPLMQREFALDLLKGTVLLTDPLAGSQQLQELNIPLHAHQPLFMIMGRIDTWPSEMRQSDKMLLMYAVHNIAEEFLSDSFRMFHIKYGQDRFVWLLQSKSDDARENDETASEGIAQAANPLRQLNGYLELVQSACHQYLRIPCSFVLVSEAFGWNEISHKFDTLSFLFARGLGTRQEILLSDKQLVDAFQEQHDGRVKMRTVQLLDDYLEKGQRTEFFELYGAFMNLVEGGSVSKTGVAVEIFYSMVSMFITYINRWGLMKTVTDTFNLNLLFTIAEHATWQETTTHFQKLANLLFDETVSENEKQTNDVIWKVQDHIRDNLGGDLSLTRLAEIVYLSPSYLSKLYKQETGQSLKDFIIDCRVQKAKELLLQRDMKIHKVGRTVGFESAAYFTRCFKKMTQLSPQEFRDLKRP
ncbi:response regulator [Paenibacillus rhizovicinus]|uniref:Response regulator n=1 Tax=Paenibacillus rhizovicinus TaxID=2704463 RepID=A0A6C0P337_9BACL|nr:response regulator [Paenibacillus rhizovicinus]QHW32887.1 response regulator [Paenibacillus rhizovicinus]